MYYFKNISSVFFVLIVLAGVFSCTDNDDQQAAVDMLTARSMGLAFLEENKLPEAESAFKHLISLSPQEPLGYANLGLVYIRTGNYPEAEKQLNLALEYAPEDPEILLNLAEVLLMTNREPEAISQLESSLRHNPDHIRTLYRLGQLYMTSPDSTRRMRSQELLVRVVDFLPANIPARFDLIDILLRHGQADRALAYIEPVRQQMPEFPEQANVFYDQCVDLLHAGNAAAARAPFNIFRNVLKPTPLYRSGFDELKGMTGPLIGTPILSFRQDINIERMTDTDVTAAIRFTDASATAGLTELEILADSTDASRQGAYILALADFDGNGTQDIYASGNNNNTGRPLRYLLRNDFGRFSDIISSAGIAHSGDDRHAIFTDYDNDGFLDLYISGTEGNHLYYHAEPGKFSDVTVQSGISGNGNGLAGIFADFDHDGDLDLFQANQDKNSFYRNNLNGSFSENAARMNLAGLSTPSPDAVFSDFDDDGDLDLFVINSRVPVTLYSNLRQGQFADISRESGLETAKAAIAVSMGDYNNDGWQDLALITADDHSLILYRNDNGEKFEPDKNVLKPVMLSAKYACRDVTFLDFDNDGFLDLLISGAARDKSTAAPGLILLRNDGKGTFSDFSSLLPSNVPLSAKIYVADFNEDGDQDIFLCGNDGRIRLLRNDGGNANNYLKVQLVGLRTGSGKNNYFGIGTRIEVKAGDLYQSHTVSQPVSHFGLGQRDKADVVRVLWTNGVPQNLFEPGSNQPLLEKQILKGSCPFLYGWNGEKFEFITDVLWRSALGMPLGIMAGETAYAFPDPARDYYRIPGDMLRERKGTYELQLTAELWETPYFDRVKLLAVDHPQGTDIFVDERFTPPPYPPFKIHTVQKTRIPVAASDEKGNNLLPLLKEKDDRYVSQMNLQKYQGVTDIHDLILDLGEIPSSEKVLLYMNGWIFPSDASINVARAQSEDKGGDPPYLQVRNAAGQWQTVIPNMSFPMGKNKYMITDLSGKWLSSDRSVRIRTGMHIFWDYAFITVGESEIPLKTSELALEGADLHYRGFSRMYRKGGRYGPFWFEYDDISAETVWRDLVGDYTRYGDVRELLISEDSKYVIANAGDEITLRFDAGSAPELPDGWTRDFIIYTAGWLKDGDLNTAAGQTVEPLPFIGMSRYPYGPGEHYPNEAEYQEYLRTYNTREITGADFRAWVKRD